ncbi:MAG: hypothetical protein ACRDJS_08370, partial [Actinomycetota bacterium]
HHPMFAGRATAETTGRFCGGWTREQACEKHRDHDVVGRILNAAGSTIVDPSPDISSSSRRGADA